MSFNLKVYGKKWYRICSEFLLKLNKYTYTFFETARRPFFLPRRARCTGARAPRQKISTSYYIKRGFQRKNGFKLKVFWDCDLNLNLDQKNQGLCVRSPCLFSIPNGLVYVYMGLFFFFLPFQCILLLVSSYVIQSEQRIKLTLVQQIRLKVLLIKYCTL